MKIAFFFSHPGGTKQGRGESSGKFVLKLLKDLSWRGLIRRVFQHLQHVNCPCGKKNFPSPDALIGHIERTHPEDADSVTFCTHTTLERSGRKNFPLICHIERTHPEDADSFTFCTHTTLKKNYIMFVQVPVQGSAYCTHIVQSIVKTRFF